MTASVALVTGGARGIGASIVSRLRAAGHPVASLDLAVPTTAREGVLDIACDLADPAAITAAVDQARRLGGSAHSG